GAGRGRRRARGPLPGARRGGGGGTRSRELGCPRRRGARNARGRHPGARAAAPRRSGPLRPLPGRQRLPGRSEGSPAVSVAEEFTLDFARPERIGLEEAIFCAGKSPEQIDAILEAARARGASLLLTRLDPEKRDRLNE